MHTGELFEKDEIEGVLVAAQVVPDVSIIEPRWRERVATTFEEATLQVPRDQYMISGGRTGRHTEHLGRLLAEMQILPRSHPKAVW